MPLKLGVYLGRTDEPVVTANTLWYPKPLDLLETGGVRIGA